MPKPVLKPSFVSDLAEACPHGPVEPEVVLAWFDLKWPTFQTYGYRNNKRAIAKWWSRVNAGELAQARELLRSKAEAAEDERLSQLADEVNVGVPLVTHNGRTFRIVAGGGCGG